MSVKISLPNQILISEDGEEVSQHRSPEEAMESASNKPGKYRLVRPDGEIVVSGDVEEDDKTPAYIVFNDVREPIFSGTPYPLSYEEAQAFLVEVEASSGPVTFSWGDQFHTENSAPFHINGDDNLIAFPEGEHEILIIAGEEEFAVSVDVQPQDEEPQPGEVIPFTQTQYPQGYYDPDNKIDEIKGKFEFLPRDANGWTIINPNPLKLVGYVDQVLGDDDVAVLVPQGTDPASIVPFKTLDKALKALPSTNTDGELHSGAHHILLHDDQVFSTSPDGHARIPSGDSHTDRLVIGRYGDGVKAPMIDDFGKGYIRLWGTCRYVIIQGVDCYNKYRDPDSPGFLGWGNVSDEDLKGGFRLYSGEIGSSYILLEGLNMNFCNFKLNGHGHSQVIANRCMVRNTYSEDSHQQGVYCAGAREVMFDDCIFDHDGWFKQREKEIKLNTKAEGRATYFNHDNYFTNIHYLWLRNPIFMRASSIGTKFASNGVKGADVDSISASHILIENPYYLEGEIGISAGGNTDHDTGSRWNHIYIIDPVLDSIGHSQPTNRSLSWGIDIHDWDTGAVVNPLFIGSDNNNLTNTYAINVTGHCRKVKIVNTIAYDIGATDKATGAYVVRYREQGQSNMSEIVEVGSLIQNPNSQCRLLSDDVVEGITRKNCIYHTKNKDQLFKFDETYLTVAEAMAHPSMEDCQFAEVVFEDPTRNIKTYMASLGLEPTVEAFAAECAKQNIKQWRPEFTAQAVNSYLREGYTPTGIRTV